MLHYEPLQFFAQETTARADDQEQSESLTFNTRHHSIVGAGGDPQTWRRGQLELSQNSNA